MFSLFLFLEIENSSNFYIKYNNSYIKSMDVSYVLIYYLKFFKMKVVNFFFNTSIFLNSF